ncbi:MAG: DUF1592 domain-containing protein [Myxococcales bacterium]
MVATLGAALDASCIGVVDPAGPQGPPLPIQTQGSNPGLAGDQGPGAMPGDATTGGGANGQSSGGAVGGTGGTGAGVVITPPSLPPLPAGAACRVGVPLRRLTETQFRNAVRDVFGNQATLPADFVLGTVGSPESGFSTDPAYNGVDLSVSREFDRGSEVAALSITDKLASIVSCAAATPNQACATTFIDQIGRRAFRRPLTSAESAVFLRAYQLGSGTDAFKDGIAAVVTAMLQSPQFLYQVEVGTPAPGETGVQVLSPYELASRLSFLLWDSIPDDALLNSARDGKLATSADVRAAADRMLGDARARPAIIRFAREWIRPQIARPGVDRTDSTYTQALSTAMQTELDNFVGNSFLAAGTDLKTFLTSSAPFGNATLRTYYEQNGGTGPRSGLLTQPAFLTGIANPSESSPIRRGVFVRRKLTCETFPAPPNNAQAVEAAISLPANANNRLRSVQRNMNATCMACHSLIDPLGLAFDSFDELGRYRTINKDGTPVDATGNFVKPVSPELAGGFSSLQELGARLGSSPAVQQCVARQFFRFNYGRLDGTADDCAIGGVMNHWKPGMDLRTLLLEIVSADEFRFRRVQ